MRIHFTSVSRPKRVAKSLRKELSSLGIAVSLPSCQNLAAEIYGYSHWHELESHIGREPASPDDEACDATVVDARRAFQTAALARRHPDLALGAGTVIASVRPTAAAEPRSDRRRAIVLERGGFSGAAMTDVVGAVPAVVTAVVLVSKGGVFRLWWLEADAREADDIWERIDTGRARNEGAVVDLFLRMFGILPASERFPTFPMPPQADLDAAREAIIRNIDREAFDIARRSSGSFSHVYDAYLMAGPGAREFGRLHPRLADKLSHAARGASPEAERRRDARQTLEAVVAGVAGLDDEAAKRAADAVEAMKDLPWAGHHFLSDLAGPLATLSRLPRERVPSSAEEAEAFREACRTAKLLAPWMSTGAGASSTADVVLSAVRGSWRDTLSAMEAAIARTTASVHARGGRIRALTGAAFARANPDPDLFGHFGDILNAFVHEVAMPALAPSDPDAAFVCRLHDQRSGALNYEVERHCVRAAAGLFAEGLTFDEALAMTEEWFVSRSAAGWRRPLAIDPADVDAVRGRLDGWRSYMRPQHRGIELHDLVALFDRQRTKAA